MNTQARLKAPNPFRGWAIELENLQDAIVVPAESRTFTQMAGVLRADGSYCSNGAVWRKDQESPANPSRPRALSKNCQAAGCGVACCGGISGTSLWKALGGSGASRPG